MRIVVQHYAAHRYALIAAGRPNGRLAAIKAVSRARGIALGARPAAGESDDGAAGGPRAAAGSGRGVEAAGPRVLAPEALAANAAQPLTANAG